MLVNSLPEDLKGRQFDYVVGWHMLPVENYGQFLLAVKQLLKPGGQFLLFEPNPWNPYYVLRKTLARLFFFFRKSKRRAQFNRIEMLSILSEIGFTEIRILPYDFLFPPVPKFLLWPMANLSLIFENKIGRAHV